MSISRESRVRLVRHQADLAATYGEFPVVEQTWEVSRSAYQCERERFDERSLGGAGVWLANERGEILLVREEGDDAWADPGGKRESGESFEMAAQREVREETGVDCRLTGLRDFHEIEYRPPDGSPPMYEAIVIFDGEHAGGEPRSRSGEIADVGWFAEPPERVVYEEVRTRPYPASE